MAEFHLITLNAKRVKETEGHYKGYNKTLLYNPDGSLIAIFPASAKQPHKNIKKIRVNCFKYAVHWLN